MRTEMRAQPPAGWRDHLTKVAGLSDLSRGEPSADRRGRRARETLSATGCGVERLSPRSRVYFLPLRCFVVNDHVGPIVLPALFFAVTDHVYGVANASEESATEGLVRFVA